ncbi:hypothetical protein Vretimale_19470 [Volvox reticuliferus]|uniref:FAST kinase leucine-rich domain-containing protein n=1 Tax=Volvox reticuliferus TaxID=1737510 RepID=A0A8J4GZ43_9CHLO|nr:hypothetical protein Vretifemale_20149 [Volvox reticuliferus]GIM16899.1 hypothetical protein Vretimale_19470 [Volvox reticuliferus]
MRMLGRQAARRFRPQFSPACPFRQGGGRRKRLAIFARAPSLSSVAQGVEKGPLRTRQVQLVWNEKPQQPNRAPHGANGSGERPPQLHDSAAAAAAVATVPSTQLDQEAAVALMLRIKAARSWQQLQSIVDESLPCMNHVHVSAVMTHMAQLHVSSSSSSSIGGVDRISGGRRGSSTASESLRNRSPHGDHRQHLETGAGIYPLGSSETIIDNQLSSRLRDHIRQLPDPGQCLLTPEASEHLHSGPCPLPPHAPLGHAAANGWLRPSASLNRDTLAGSAGQGSLLLSKPPQRYDQHRFYQHRVTDARTVFLQQLERAVTVHLPDFEGRQLANTLWAVAKLGYKPSERWLEVLLTRACAQMHTFNPQHLANTLYALMLLRYMPPPAWLESFYTTASQRLHDFGPGELSHLCYAAGKLRLKPGLQLLGGVLHHSMLHMQYYDARELALLLYGIVHMGARLHADWLRVYRRRVMELVIGSGALSVRLIERLSGQLNQPSVAHLASLQLAQSKGQLLHSQPQMESATQLQHCMDFSMPTAAERSTSLALTAPRPSSSLRAAWVASYLPTVLCSLAEIGYRPPPVFMSTVLAAVGSCATQLTPVGLTTVLLSLANMKYRPHPAFFRRVWKLLMDGLDSLDTQQCTIAVWTCATLGCNAPRHDLAAVLMNVAARLPEHSDGELLQLLEAVSCLGLKPTTSWLELLESDLYNRLPRMRPREVAGLLLPLAGLRHKPHRLWMARWAEALQAGLLELGLRQMATAVYGAARLGFLPPSRLCAELLVATGRGIAATAMAMEVPPTDAAQKQERMLGQEVPEQNSRRMRPAWVRRQGDRSGGRLPETLSRLLWALAVLDMAPDEVWLSGYMGCLRLVRGDLSPQEKGQVAWALARLRYQPGPEWAEELALWQMQQRQVQQQRSNSDADAQGLLTRGGGTAGVAAIPAGKAAVTAAAVAVDAQAELRHEMTGNCKDGVRRGGDPATARPSGASTPGDVQLAADSGKSSVASGSGRVITAVGLPVLHGSSNSNGSTGMDPNTFVLQGLQEWAARQLGEPDADYRRQHAVGRAL